MSLPIPLEGKQSIIGGDLNIYGVKKQHSTRINSMELIDLYYLNVRI